MATLAEITVASTRIKLRLSVTKLSTYDSSGFGTLLKWFTQFAPARPRVIIHAR